MYAVVDPHAEQQCCCVCRVLIYEPVMEGRLVPADVDDSYTSNNTSSRFTQSGKPRTTAAAAAPAGPDEDDAAADPNYSKLNASASPNSIQLNATAGPVNTSSSTDVCKPVGVAVSEGEDVPGGSSSSSSRLTKTQRLLRRLAALQATFAFSGAWHALIFYYATGYITPHWFTFFSIQAPIMAVEAILIKWAKSRQMMLPRPVSIFLTNFLLIVVANPLFFGPCDWSGMCTAMLDNVKGSVAA